MNSKYPDQGTKPKLCYVYDMLDTRGSRYFIML